MVAPINLNRARKLRERLAAEAEAAANRVKFGRSKAARASARLTSDAADKHLDGHKLDGDDGG